MSKGWPRVRLGEVLTRSSETVALRPDATYREVTVKLWGKGVVPRGETTGLDIAAERRSVVRRGQLVLSRIDARNGALGIVPKELDGAIVSNDFPAFVAAQDRLLPDFLGWLCRTAGFVEGCQRASEGTTNRVRMQEERFLSMEVPLPPVPEQRRVVGQIDALAARIEQARTLRQRAMEQAEALRRASTEATYQRLREQFGTKLLAEVCEAITDGDHNTPSFADHGVRFIFVGNVSSGRLHFDNAKRVSEAYFRTLTPQRVPKRGDLLFSAVGATLGIPAVVDSDEPFCFQRHVAILKPNRRQVDSRFVWHMLRSRTSTAGPRSDGSGQSQCPAEFDTKGAAWAMAPGARPFAAPAVSLTAHGSA